MPKFIKTIVNAALVVGGFLVVFFGVSEISNKSEHSFIHLSNVNDFGGVAHADAPTGGDPTPVGGGSK